MSNQSERWQAVADQISARMRELSVTKAEVMRMSSISQKSLDGYLAGQPIVRADKARGLCDALGWTVDSIDRILAGEEPALAASRTEAAIMEDPLLGPAARTRLVQAYRAAVATSRR